MSPEIISLLIDIGISLLVALIGWEVIPMNTPEDKMHWWNKIQPALKWSGSLATFVFTIILIMKIFN